MSAKSMSLTQENWFSPIGLWWTQDPSVSQVLPQYDGKPRLVEGFHDNWTHSFVVGKEVEGSEEEEEAESQSGGESR